MAAFTECDAWLAGVVDLLDQQRRRLGSLLAHHLPAAGYHPPEASFLAWLDLRSLGLGDDPADRLLATARVALNSGHRYGTQGLGHARLNFACSPSTLTEAVERIARASGAQPVCDGP